MSKAVYEIGILGAGVMGRALALSIADHGYSVAVYDNSETLLRHLESQIEGRSIEVTGSMAEFIGLLGHSRIIMLIASARPQTEGWFNQLLPHLDGGDLVIDAGSSYFKETDVRAKLLGDKGIESLSAGISASRPSAHPTFSIMLGGPARVYNRVKPLFEQIAAEEDRKPCAALLGERSAGHFACMVCDGIEQGLRQLITEVYDLMKHGLGMSNDAIEKTCAQWNETEAGSYLLETVANNLRYGAGLRVASLSDLLSDKAMQSGNFTWVSQEAIALNVPVPTIEIGTIMQSLSSYEHYRTVLENILSHRPIHYLGKPDILLNQMKNALYTGMIMMLAQGMALLQVASSVYEYDFELEEVARVWRGSAIGMPMLKDISDAFYVRPDLPNLLSDWQFAYQTQARLEDLRTIVRLSAELNILAPALNSSLTYYNDYQNIAACDLKSSSSQGGLSGRGYQKKQARADLAAKKILAR